MVLSPYQVKDNMAESYTLPDGQMVDTFDSLGNIKSNYNKELTNPLGSTPPSPSPKLDSAQLGMIYEGVKGTADLAAGIIGGVLDKKDNEQARQEARQLAEINRQDQLKQDKIDLAFRKRQQDQEEQQFKIQKRIQMYDQKFNVWETAFRKALANQQKAQEAAMKLLDMQRSNNGEQIRQQLTRKLV